MMETNFKNNLAPAVIELNRMNEELQAENEWLKEKIERLEGFCHELIKECNWLPTTHTPTINGFETMVQCTNGKKRVASFRMFDSHWYDVNNGNKLNVVKWLWQPSMAQGEEGTEGGPT